MKSVPESILLSKDLSTDSLEHRGPHSSLNSPRGWWRSTPAAAQGSVSTEKWKWSRSVVSDSLWPHGLYGPWNSPGQNTGVGSLPLLQGIFPTQESNPGLPHCRWILYQLSHKGNPIGKCQFTADRRKGWRILQVRYLAVVNNINSDQFRVKALLGKCIHTLSFIIINLNILFARNFLSENLNSND